MVQETGDGLARWNTPLGPLWSPVGTNVRFAMAEQVSEVYTEDSMALKPGDVVLDCGAAFGDFVRTCLKARVAKVVAIEPSPGNIEAMRRSFPAEIASGQVVIVPKGVWHEDSTLKLLVHQNSLLDSLVMHDRVENQGGPKPREVEVPLTTIDKIVEELKLEKVTFLKMDIEGAERNALRGAAKTIARFHPRMALATENLQDDYIAVPQEVRKIAQNYDIRCGLCRQIATASFRPDILFFTPR
jgi:FkbM family methyltransferase